MTNLDWYALAVVSIALALIGWAYWVASDPKRPVYTLAQYTDLQRRASFLGQRVRDLKAVLDEVAKLPCNDFPDFPASSCQRNDGTGLWCVTCRARAALNPESSEGDK